MSVPSTEYRNAISRFLSGVTVVTTRHAGANHGITASAVCSVTLEPPTLLVCLNRQSATCHAVIGSGRFCVNVLADDQLALAKLFSSKSADKFAEFAALSDAPCIDGPFGTPILPGALAALECAVTQYSDVGTHRVFFGQVLGTTVAEGEPLGYFRGQFTTLQREG